MAVNKAVSKFSNYAHLLLEMLVGALVSSVRFELTFSSPITVPRLGGETGYEDNHSAFTMCFLLHGN